jgi:NADH/NAD ratio-sensing transcriptional regulator Rex
MSGKRSLFDVIENGKEIEKDLNLTSMERISKGVDKLIGMTEDAFEHIQSLEDALEQTNAMASKTRRDLEYHIHENRARYGALVKKVTDMSDAILTLRKCTALLLEQAGEIGMAEGIRDQIERQREEEENNPF